ncbi:MAG: hypothetical protein ABTQ73_01620 [Caldilineales bacterium]
MPEITFPKRMTDFVEDTTHSVMVMPQRMLDASRGAFNTTREEAEGLMERGENLFDKLVERGQEIENPALNRVVTLWKQWSRRGMEQLHVAEEQLEQQVQAMLAMLHIPNMDDIKRIDSELDRIARKLDAQLVQQELAALPIMDYKTMNVKDVVAQLDELTQEQLQAVQQFEAAHLNRKTILRQIEQRMEAVAE